MSHQWFYIKPGMISDETVGPLTQKEFIRAVRDGKVARDGLVSSPTQTKGQWMEVQQIPKLLELWVDGKELRDADAQLKKSQREEAKRQKQARKQAEAVKKSAEKEAAAAQRRAQQEALADEQKRQQSAEEARRQQAHELEMQQRAAMPAPQPQPAPSTVYVPQPAQPSTVVVQSNQSQTVPILLNLFCTPGFGQIVQGRVGTGLLIMLIFWLSIITIVGPLIVMIWAVIDAAKYNSTTVVVTR